MSFFDRDDDDEVLELKIGGEAKDKVLEAAEVLEVDSPASILPIMVGVFCEAVLLFGRDEKYRDLSVIDPLTMNAVKLVDFEELRIKAKKIELDFEEKDKEDD